MPKPQSHQERVGDDSHDDAVAPIHTVMLLDDSESGDFRLDLHTGQGKEESLGMNYPQPMELS